jgi:hypothetical protein
MKKIIYLLLVCSCFTFCDKDSALSAGYAAPQGAGGSMARFAIVGNYLYAVDDSRLRVFDISVASTPVLKSTVGVGFEIETIFPFKDKLFIGSTSQVHIFNIDNPIQPQKLSVAISPTVIRRCDPVVAKDTVAYATLRSNSACGGVQSILSVIDIRDINNPVERFTVMLSEPYGLGYANDVLYVCDGANGLVLFDISNAWAPTEIKRIHDAKYIDVIPMAGVLVCWTQAGVVVYDITDNRNPVLLATIH